MIVVIQKQVSAISVNKQAVVKVRIAEFNIPSGILTSSFSQKGSLLVGLGDGEFLELPPGADGEYVQYDSTAMAGIKTAVPSIDVDDTTNHLINGGFPFAQRQTPGTLTTISDNSYGPDRWKMTRENADLQYVRVDGSGDASLTSPFYGQFKKITNAGKLLICQPLTNIDTLKFRGRGISFQLQMKASSSKTIKIAIVELQSGGTADSLPSLVSSWNADGSDPTLGANLATIGTPQSCSVTTTWQVFQYTGTFPANSKNIMVMVWSDADFAVNDTLSLAEAGMYYGTNIRSWSPQPISTELELCKVYGRLVNKTAAGRADTTTRANFGYPLSPPMRISPTPSILGTIVFKDFNQIGGAGENKTANSPSVATSGGTTDGVYLQLSASSLSASNFTAGDIVMLNCSDNNGIFLSAEL